jgi:dimethylhistidine N-methyltransferase
MDRPGRNSTDRPGPAGAGGQAGADLSAEFAQDVARGLGYPLKHLDCRYFYDREGSLLFEEICRLPEYYQTRTEKKMLEDHVGEIIGGLPEDLVLVELGSGSSMKTRIIIEALLRKNGRASYTPIDISRSMLEETAADLRKRYDGLDIVSIAAEYREGLRSLRQFDRSPRLVIWLGSSIGNFERDDAVGFLKGIVKEMSLRDRLLIGFDMVKDIDVLKAAYNDSSDVTAEFNLNLLARINRELGGRFEIGSFRHVAEYNTDRDRIEMYLVSRKDQDVRIDALDRTFHFDEGERIHTENSHKYTSETIRRIAFEAGLRVMRQWYDPKRWFNLTLFCPQE